MAAKFGALAGEVAAKAAPPAAAKAAPADPAPVVAKVGARAGLKPVIGYYSPAMRKALRHLATEEETTIQALVGEALDLLFRDRGKHPLGER